eukprot:GEMP01050697.1.p1 GENE.GEMP01050697.1~~GEMP01050697.1.p1  ORF type:complete len:100 (+),score=1.84 GEMP01050697.1:1111-1410(+)
MHVSQSLKILFAAAIFPFGMPPINAAFLLAQSVRQNVVSINYGGTVLGTSYWVHSARPIYIGYLRPIPNLLGGPPQYPIPHTQFIGSHTVFHHTKNIAA